MPFFLTIIATCIISFGVSLEAILEPKDSFSFKEIGFYVIQIFNQAYWPIYGELGVLDRISNKTICTSNPAINETNKTAFFLLMIYMVIANVLLINILIAMFR